MKRDRRWREVSTFLQWFKGRGDDAAAQEFLSRFQKYAQAIDALAADHTLPAEERKLARGLSEQLTVYARAHIPEALRALAEIAASDDRVDPETRAKAQERLTDATLNMQTPSEKRH
jgi:hypothetical protein